jgi:large repetitive protein
VPEPPTLELSPEHDTGRSASDGITADSTPHVMGMAEAGGIVSVYDGGEFIGSAPVDMDGMWEFQPEALADGDHSITASAADVAGNDSPDTEVLTVRIDTQRPSAPAMTRPTDGTLTRESTVATEGTAEADASVEVFDGTDSKGDAMADAAGDWALDVVLLDGNRTLTARATDVAGNRSDASGARAVTVDTVAPETSIESGPNNPTQFTTATFAFSSTESPSTFECRLDDEGFAPCQSPRHYDPVAPGTHTFQVRAADAAGNVDPTPASWTWTLDPQVPRAPVLTAPEDGTHTSSTAVTVAGTAEAGVTVEVFDGQQSAGSTTADAAGAWSVDVTGLADGAHEFTAKATNAGFTSAPSAAATVTVDTAAPQTSIDSGPDELTSHTDAAISFSSDESGATFECRLDGGAFTACTSPHTITGLADGAHTVEVRAVDLAGNSDATPATRTWTVDATAPETTIQIAPAPVVASDSATFEFSSNEAGSSFECRLDGSAFTSCSSPHQVSGLSPGSHTFEVRAIDRAGNVDPTPAPRTWTAEVIIFSDGFESGNFSAWSVVETGADGTAAVQSAVVRSGLFAARLSETANTGSYAFARKSFALQRDITVSGNIQIQAEGASGGNVPIFRLFDATGTRVVNLKRQNVNGDRIWIEYTGANASTPGRLPLNTWARFEVHVVVAGPGADTVELLLNGVQIFRTTSATLGANGVGTVQIGNETKKQAFALVADDIEVRAR